MPFSRAFLLFVRDLFERSSSSSSNSSNSTAAEAAKGSRQRAKASRQQQQQQQEQQQQEQSLQQQQQEQQQQQQEQGPQPCFRDRCLFRFPLVRESSSEPMIPGSSATRVGFPSQKRQGTRVKLAGGSSSSRSSSGRS
eukprot:s6103_g1.t1